MKKSTSNKAPIYWRATGGHKMGRTKSLIQRLQRRKEASVFQSNKETRHWRHLAAKNGFTLGVKYKTLVTQWERFMEVLKRRVARYQSLIISMKAHVNRLHEHHWKRISLGTEDRTRTFRGSFCSPFDASVNITRRFTINGTFALDGNLQMAMGMGKETMGERASLARFCRSFRWGRSCKSL